jgi:DNA-3-methyladenine glycosylase II
MVQWMRAHPEKNSTAALQCEIALPKQFRLGDVLSFHRRDAQMVAERVEAAALHKGLLWDGSPACLTIRFESRFVAVELAIDGSADDDDGAALSRMVRRMLGLTQRVEEFEAIYHDHSQVGPLIARNPGLRVPLTPTPFEALTWAITGQQITVGAATSIRRKLIQAGSGATRMLGESSPRPKKGCVRPATHRQRLGP